MGDFDDDDTNWDETTTLPLIPSSVTPQKRVLFVLQQVTGPGSPRNFEITESETILGRGKECGIHIDLPDLSRAHAKLFCLNDECLLKDLKSRNGCFLNGVKVHAATLRGGDTLQVGRIIFTFHEGRP
jgi:pSer/pThr/pTyr-binding forkhead associated (FHA) protein